VDALREPLGIVGAITRGTSRSRYPRMADNEAAIRAHEKVGFRRVGVMRLYERGQNRYWHDGLLMEMLADELTQETDAA
jgi:aminoglycoside 6'-N-acetyltransferase